MRVSHFIRAHLGPADPLPTIAGSATTRIAVINLVSGRRTLDHGIGRALTDAARLRMVPSETALDLLVLAALVYAADTRIPRAAFSQDSWNSRGAAGIASCRPRAVVSKCALAPVHAAFFVGRHLDNRVSPPPARLAAANTGATPCAACLQSYLPVLRWPRQPRRRARSFVSGSYATLHQSCCRRRDQRCTELADQSTKTQIHRRSLALLDRVSKKSS